MSDSFLQKAMQLIVEEILKQPYFIIGITVVIGYIILKKKWYEVLSGFIRAVVGYMILQVGSGGLSGVANPFINGLKSLNSNLTSTVILDTYTTQSTIEQWVGNLVSAVYMVLLCAFVLNIVLVALQKWTKLRAIFTTGHVQMQQAFLGFFILAWGFKISFPTTEIPFYLYIIAGLILGLYWAVGGNLTLKPTQELTDGAGFAIAHQQMFSIALLDIIGTRVQRSGKKINKLENLKLPGWLSIFNDSMVATTFIMTLFFGTIAIIVAVVNPEYWPTQLPVLDAISAYQQNVLFYVFKLICQFAVYLAILQLGVRTFVTELTNAFQGISDKLLPGAVPAVDCAVAYGFGSQNAITFGFISGAIGQIVGTVILVATGGLGMGVLVITMFVPIFFDNATIGVFANTKLGIRGTFIAPFINGLLQILLSAWLANLMGLTTGWDAASGTAAGAGAWMAMNDWITVWPLFGIIIRYLPVIGAAVVILVLLAIPQLQYYFSHKKEDRDDYYLQVSDWEAYKAKHITPYLKEEA
ncbi:MAG: PTS transporter subunit IIC [Erysipelotrichaceae bacterium]|jgi:PTS system ascorbate-specific IIC component|nr:PTS transporter subunit IIC [Erysipelotrichaceae bacterium]